MKFSLTVVRHETFAVFQAGANRIGGPLKGILYPKKYGDQPTNLGLFPGLIAILKVFFILEAGVSYRSFVYLRGRCFHFTFEGVVGIQRVKLNVNCHPLIVVVVLLIVRKCGHSVKRYLGRLADDKGHFFRSSLTKWKARKVH